MCDEVCMADPDEGDEYWDEGVEPSIRFYFFSTILLFFFSFFFFDFVLFDVGLSWRVECFW